MLTEAQDAAALLDEQDTCVGEPGWYTGTYFTMKFIMPARPTSTSTAIALMKRLIRHWASS